MRLISAFGRFWYDFIIGDDWRIAAGVVFVLVVGAVAILAGVTTDLLAPALAFGLVAVFAVGVVRAEH